jgi:hypothetical protein
MTISATTDILFADAMIGFSEPSTRFLIIFGGVSLILFAVFMRMKLG